MSKHRRHVGGVVIALALGAGAAACGSDDSAGSDAKETPSKEASPSGGGQEQPTEPAWGEPITTDIATEVTVEEPQPGAPARIDVRVSATNTGLADGKFDLFLACTGNAKTGTIVVDTLTPSPQLTSGTVPMGTTVDGYVSLDLPQYQGAVVEACEPGRINLVVAGFAGQDVVHPLADDLAEHLLAGS